MRIIWSSLIFVLATCMAAAQFQPFGNADRFSEDAVLLDLEGFPSFVAGKYLFSTWGLTFSGERGVLIFHARQDPPTSAGPPNPPPAILSNGIPDDGSTEVPFVIESDQPLSRIGFTLVPHNAEYGDSGLAVSATTTITASDQSGRVLGSVVQEGKWVFVGLEVQGTEEISRVSIKSDQGIEGIKDLVLEYRARPLFTTYLPQLANGEGVRSSITFLNLSNSTAHATIRFFDSAGAEQALGGIGEKADLTLHPRTANVLLTTGVGELKAGYGIVTSNCPLQVQTIYTTKEPEGMTREAGVVGVTSTYRSVGAIAKKSENRVDTAIAVINPNAFNWAVRFDLINGQTGSIHSSRILEIPARGQIAKFVSELFPELVDNDWEGSVRVWSGKPLAVMVVHTFNGFATASFPCGGY